MLEEILRYLNNWFLVCARVGTFKIEGGRIALPFLKSGQYYRILGSTFNDGVYRYGEETLTDEEFDGAVWALAIPRALLDIVPEIEKWQKKNAGIVTSPYASESFGGYSYTKKSGNSENGIDSWQNAFKARLSAWRKL